jgi:uncharacterized protein
MAIQYQDTKYGGIFFQEQAGQRVAEITYRWRDTQTIVADHTWVDDRLRGQGVARQMLDALVALARERQLKIVPQCSYVDVMFRRDANFRDIQA